MDGRRDYEEIVKIYAARTDEEPRRYSARARSRGDCHGSIRIPKPGPNLHDPHRAPKRSAPVAQAAHKADVCVQQEVGYLKDALALHFAYYNLEAQGINARDGYRDRIGFGDFDLLA